MAQVLAPILQTSGSITMPYSSSDAYQNSPQSQQRASQMPRNQMYNGTPGGSGYRGTSAPIAPYAFSTTPSLRVENRSASTSSAPQQSPNHANQARLGHPSHPSSSSDSTVSTSGSSNRSLVGPSMASKDDSDVKKTIDNHAPSIPLNGLIPDLSLNMTDAPAKAAPGRYRRVPGRADSSNNANSGSTTPTQRSTSTAAPSLSPAALPQTAASSGLDLPPAVRPGHNRASSADDTVARSAGFDPAKRYRRRSFNGLEEKHLTSNMASLQVGSNTAQNTPPNNSQNATRPASSAGRPGSRPTSSHSHDRQGSVGSGSSKTSARSQVSL